MNRMTSLTTLKCLVAAGALIAAGLVSVPADAGYASKGWAGTGFQTSELPAVGQPMTESQTAYRDAFKNHLLLSDEEAQVRGTEIHKALCKAIELVKKRNAVVGNCLADRKKDGTLCVAFDIKTPAAIKHEGKAACSKKDRINISYKEFGSDKDIGEVACPPSYDPSLYDVATALLHEGTHATQDYTTDTAGLDDCKKRAKKLLTRVCHEGGSGVDGEAKGAHVIENEWITEIKAALTELGTAMPEADPAWSDATKDIFTDINKLMDTAMDTARTDAINALNDAITTNEKDNNNLIACYQQLKTLLQNFIDTKYTTEAEKTAAKEALRDGFNDIKWKTVKRYNISAITLISNAQSPVIEQLAANSTVNNLDTGLLGVSDMELRENISGPYDLLIVVGPIAPDQGRVQVYADINLDGVFEPTELTDSFFTPVGVTGNMDLIIPHPDVSPGAHPMMLFNHDTFEFFTLQENYAYRPSGMDPIPAFQIQQPQNVDHAYFVQEWDWDDQRLIGYDDVIAGAPAPLYDDEVLVLDDLNLDGVPDSEAPIATVLSLIDYAPTWGGDPQAGDFMMDLYGYPDHQIEVRVLDSNYATIETLASQLTTSIDPVTVALSRPLAPNDQIILSDLTNGMSSPLLVIPTPPCQGDINGDGTTDTADLGILLANFGQIGAGPSDLNGDGFTDTADLGILLANFGCPF